MKLLKLVEEQGTSEKKTKTNIQKSSGMCVLKFRNTGLLRRNTK